MNELVIVSGASSGVGAATALEFAQRGYHVLAGVRRKSDGDLIRAERIEPIILDITQPADIANVAARVASDPLGRGLRALINNAGIQINAPIEVLPLSEWRSLFDVNLFGHVEMIQTLLPEIIKNKGSIVNITSVGGKIAMPMYGPYASTKFALEAVSDALRREVEQHGVKVIVVEPGAVSTKMLKGVSGMGESIIESMTAEQRERYSSLMYSIVSQAESASRRGLSADKVGRVIVDAATSRRPRTRYAVGNDAALVVRLTEWLSDRMLDVLLARSLRTHLPQN